MNNINIGLIVDIIMGVILLFFMYKGMRNGFSGEIIGLVGFFAGIFCAWKFLDPAVELAMRYIHISLDRNVISLVCAIAIFFVVELIFAIIGWILSMVVRVTQLSLTDHVFGMLIGILKACFIVLVVYAVAEIFSPVLPSNWMNESYAMKGASYIWPHVRDLLQEHGLLDFTILK